MKRIFILLIFSFLGSLLYVKEHGEPFWTFRFFNKIYSFQYANHATLIEKEEPQAISFFRCQDHFHTPILLGPYPFTSQVRFLLFFEGRIFYFDDSERNLQIKKETILIKKNMVDFPLEITETEKGFARNYFYEQKELETIYKIEFHDGHELEIHFPPIPPKSF